MPPDCCVKFPAECVLGQAALLKRDVVNVAYLANDPNVNRRVPVSVAVNIRTTLDLARWISGPGQHVKQLVRILRLVRIHSDALESVESRL